MARTTPDLTHLSLFTGIGGFDIACEAAGFRTVGQVEIADYPFAVLKRHWPAVPKWRDIRTVTADALRRAGIGTPTLLTGGFPCQPFSLAGNMRGTSDDRFLWPEMLRVIDLLRPSWVVGENVAHIVKMALDICAADLEDRGYAVRAFVLPAAGVGAPQMRDRCFIVAHAVCAGEHAVRGTVGARRRTAGEGEAGADGRPGDGPCDGLCQAQSGLDGVAHELPQGLDGDVDPWAAEWPGVPRVATGIPNQAFRINAIGNAVVPAQVYPIVRTIADIERGLIR